LTIVHISARHCWLVPTSFGVSALLSGLPMLKVKDTLRATVNLTFDGRVIKVFHGPNAAERFANEVRVLRHLEARGCKFVPRLLEADPDKLRIVTTNCGGRVEHLDEQRRGEIFAELEQFGVRHDDPDMRNVTYRAADGRFCIIDFELATLLPDPAPKA
jgi:predicted Ser/Thr protein kinase